jgi:rubredoxin-NAD+ reductase
LYDIIYNNISTPDNKYHEQSRWIFIVCGTRSTFKNGGFFMKYVCDTCGWEYDEELGDPENGIAPGTKFADLPDDFECPVCGVGKDDFSEA